MGKILDDKTMKEIKTVSYPKFPELAVGKTRRCYTKHLSNAAMYLYPDELSLLHFIIYQTSADNTFKYSMKFLNQYLLAVQMLQAEYNRKKLGACNIIYARRTMKSLIEQGYVLKTNKNNVLMVNPILTYSVDVVNSKQYKGMMETYQTSPDQIVIYFNKIVSSFLESKKKNYVYKGK